MPKPLAHRLKTILYRLNETIPYILNKAPNIPPNIYLKKENRNKMLY